MQFKINIVNIVILTGLILSSCSYPIKYKLNDRDIVSAQNKVPLRVQVAGLTEKRELIERKKSARKDRGFQKTGDYTYDKNFNGSVAEKISKMLVSHLDYSKVFATITLSSYNSETINADVLTKLANQGVDAVFMGEVQNFYGFYENDTGRGLLYSLGLGLGIGIPVTVATAEKNTTRFGSGEFTEVKINPLASSLAISLGTSLGLYLDSLHKRNIEAHTRLAVKMVKTSNGEVLWEDTFNIQRKANTTMPGLNTSKRKFELAVNSLRDAVNAMVKSLSKTDLITKK